ncbi:MAG: hypothetical protein OHK0022_31750 [Roseiflexaceae bacterium]
MSGQRFAQGYRVLVALLLLTLITPALTARPAQAAPAASPAAAINPSQKYRSIGEVDAGSPIAAFDRGQCQVLRIDTRNEDGYYPQTPAIGTLRDLNAYVLWDAYFWRKGDGAVVKIYRNTATAPGAPNEYIVNVAGSVPAPVTPDLHDLYANIASQSPQYMGVKSPYTELVKLALLDAAKGEEPVFQGEQKRLIMTGHSQGGNVAQNMVVGVAMANTPEFQGTDFDRIWAAFLRNNIKISGGVFAGSRPSFFLDYLNRTQRRNASLGQAPPYDSFLFQAENDDPVPTLATPDTAYGSNTTLASDLTATYFAAREAAALARIAPFLAPLPLANRQVRQFLDVLGRNTYGAVDVGLEASGFDLLPTLPTQMRQFVLQRAQVSFDDQRPPDELEHRNQGYYAHGSSYGDPTIPEPSPAERSPHTFLPRDNGNDGLTNLFPRQVPARWVLPSALTTSNGAIQLEYVAGYGFDCRSAVQVQRGGSECFNVQGYISEQGKQPDGIPDTAWADTTAVYPDGKQLDPDMAVKEGRIFNWANTEGTVPKEPIYWNSATATLSRNVHSVKCMGWDAYADIPAPLYVGQHTVKTDVEVGDKVEGFVDGSWVAYGIVAFDRPAKSISVDVSVVEENKDTYLSVHLDSPDSPSIAQIVLDSTEQAVSPDHPYDTVVLKKTFHAGVPGIQGAHYVYLKARQFPRPSRIEDQTRNLITLHALRFSPQPPPPPPPPRPDSLRPMRHPPRAPANPSRGSWRGGGPVFSGSSSRLGTSSGGSGVSRTTPPPPELRPRRQANGHGDPHINTIDGVAYTSLALGEFIYVRDTVATTGGLEVQARQERLPGFPDWASFITAAAVRAGNTTFEVRLPEQGSRVLPLYINQQPVYLAPGDYRFGDTSVTVGGDNTITVRVPTTPDGEAEARIGTRSEELAGASTEPVVALDVAFSSPSNDGRYRGVFGTSDGSLYNELVDRAGNPVMTIDEVAEAWRITDAAESLFTYAPGQGPATFNKTQDARFPDAAYLAGDNPQRRNYIQEAQDLLVAACQTSLDMIDPAFITEVALELATGRSADNIVAGGLCNAPQVDGAGQDESAALIGLTFTGAVKLAERPDIGLPGVRVQITAPELGDALLCDTTSYDGGAYGCDMSDLPSFFGGRTELSLRYTVSGRGPTVVFTGTTSVPAPGASASHSKDLTASPATVLILTGQLSKVDGTELPGGLLRLSGPAYTEGVADAQGVYTLALPLPDGLRKTTLAYEAGDLASNTYVKLSRTLTLTTTGLVTITQNLRMQAAPIPNSDPGAQAAKDRLLLVSGMVRNSASGNSGVAGLEVTVTSAGLEGGLCRTATGSDGSYTCSAKVKSTQAFSATVTARGLSVSEAYHQNIVVGSEALPAPGSSALVSVPDIVGSFQARVLNVQLSLVNALAPGEAVFATQAEVRSPQLGQLCTYNAPAGFASFTCQAQVVASQPFDLEYTVSGPWGTTATTSTVTTVPPSGPISSSATASVSPITMAVGGRILDHSNPLANVQLTLSSPQLPRDYRSNSDALGGFSFTPYLINELERSGTLTLTAKLNQATTTVTTTFSDLVAGSINPVALGEIGLSDRTLDFDGMLVNRHTGQALNADNSDLTIRRASDDSLVCQTSASGWYNCQAALTDAAPFAITYAVSGTWGSATDTSTAPLVGVGITGRHSHNIQVSPTMVQFDGVVQTKNGQPVSRATIYLNGPSLYGYQNVQSGYDGRFSIKAVVRPGVESGPVRFQVSSSNGYFEIDSSFANVTQAGQVNVQAPQTLTLFSPMRWVSFRGRVSNSLAPAMDLSNQATVTIKIENQEQTVGIYSYYNPNSYGASFNVPTTRPFSVTYTVGGEWGSKVFTTTVDPDLISNDAVVQDLAISATTLRVSGRFGSDSAPFSYVGLNMHLEPSSSGVLRLATTDVQGNYSLELLVPSGVTSGTLHLRSYISGIWIEREQAVSGLLPDQVNQRTFDVTANLLRVSGQLLNGNLPITNYDGTPTFAQLRAGSSSISVSADGQQLCQLNYVYSTYDCTFLSDQASGFDLTIEATGEWGTATITQSVPAAAERPSQIVADLTVYPTTLQLTGRITGLENAPLRSGVAYLNSYDGEILSADGGYADENGVYTITAVLRPDVVSGTLSFWVDPYYTGEGSSDFETTIERPFSGVVPGGLTTLSNDFSFNERPLRIGLNLENEITGDWLPFNSAEVRRKDTGELLCTISSSGSSCRTRLTSNADFTAVFNVQADWGNAQIEGVVRPPTETSYWTSYTVEASVRSTTLQVVGTVTRAGQPVSNLYVWISGPSIVSSRGGYTDANGQYSIYVVPRADSPSGQLQVYLSYPFYQTFNGTYSIPPGQSGAVVTVAGPPINLP